MTGDFQRTRYEERRGEALQRLRDAEPGTPCPCCGHIAYPIVAHQGCWCDPGICVDASHEHTEAPDDHQ